MASALRSQYPWLTTPAIINAPMAGFAGASLATAVTLAGGLGFIGGLSYSQLDAELHKASETFSSSPMRDHNHDHSPLLPLPLGFGVIICAFKLEDALALLKTHRPAAIWLFAAHELSDYATWSRAIRAASPTTRLWIQVGSVAAAIEVARTAAPNVVVAQGVDAGGHGFEKGAGVVSLVPEICDAFAGLAGGEPIVVAAGGIADGRGVAAALALGAGGVVMGTRFLASEEVGGNAAHGRAVVAAADGGQTTVRAKVFDELKGKNWWPDVYDGRSIVTGSYTDFEAGMGVEELRALYTEASALPHAGYGDGAAEARTAIWAGTAVGLVHGVKTAGEIVRDTQEGARVALDKIRSRI